MKKNTWIMIGTAEVSDKFAKALKLARQDIVGVVSTSIDKGKAFADKWGIKNVYCNIEDINVEYYNVYIASPNIFHYEQAKYFLGLKKNVMVEKPMTHRPDYTNELFELANTNKVKVMEAYAHLAPKRFENLRLKGHHLQVNYMQLSSKVKAGITKTASSFRKDRFGGAVPDLGVYPISLAVWLMGPVAKIAISHHAVYNEVEVDVTFKLTHTNGTITETRISKMEDGDNCVYLDGKLIAKHVSASEMENRMSSELDVFLSDKWNFSHDVSTETAKVVAALKKILKTE